jgi:large subunit ribosomal protein L5
MSLFADVQPKIMKELNLTNVQAVPKVTKVVVNVGVGKQRDNRTYIEAVMRDVAAITGQKPQERKARMAVSGFNVRQGNLVGYRVTLRGKRAEQFVQRFVNITLPRVRDFRGLPLTSIDRGGNLSVGLREHLAFPEIHADKTDAIFGVQVTFATTAKDKTKGEVLFRALGFPFSKADLEEELELETAASRAAREKKKGAHTPKA